MLTATHNSRHEREAGTLLPCPTCWIGTADQASAAVARFGGEDGYDVAPATCPTCLVASVEWGLVVATDALVNGLLGMARLEATVFGSR